MKTKTLLVILGIALVFIIGIVFALNQLGLLTITPSPEQVYYYQNTPVKVEFIFDPGKVGEDSSSKSTYHIIGGVAIVEKNTQDDKDLKDLYTQVNAIGYGEGHLWGDTKEARIVRALKTKMDYIGGRASDTFPEISSPGGTKKVVDGAYVPTVSGTYDNLVVYEFFCELGFKYINQWNCFADRHEIIGINKDFCGNIGLASTPNDLIKTPTWDDYCFGRYSPGYCDKLNHKCIPLCSAEAACSGDQYCLAKYADNAKQITDLLDKWEKNKEKGTLGCVDKDKICESSEDCRAMGGMINEYKYNAGHCEKTDIPGWLKDTNELVDYGAFGMCKPGCEIDMDCTETIGDADNFKANVFGRLIAGESWTCLSDGHCRLNLCNHDTDCWAIQRTQMSLCESGVCERITCSDHYDCWDYVIIESGLDNYQYGCFDHICQYAEWDSPGYLSPSLCEAAFGVPTEGKAWRVKGGKCTQETIIENECTVGASKNKIQTQCTNLKGEPTEGYEWACIRVPIGTKTKGVCNEVQIPVTENCQMANNPDEYCMYHEGVENLARGKKWICSENGICVLTIATCTTDADCRVGSIGGTCIDGFCQYGYVPPVPIEPVCGNGICEAGEDKNNCAEDCGTPNPLFKWDNLYLLPILLTFGLALLFGWRGKQKTEKYHTFDFIIGGVLGVIIGIVAYFIIKYWVWIALVTLIGGGGAIVLILAIGGAPLLWFIFNYLSKGRAVRLKKYYEKPRGEYIKFKERYY